MQRAMYFPLFSQGIQFNTYSDIVDSTLVRKLHFRRHFPGFAVKLVVVEFSHAGANITGVNVQNSDAIRTVNRLTQPMQSWKCPNKGSMSKECHDYAFYS